MVWGTELSVWLRVGLLLVAASAVWLCWYGWWIARRAEVAYCLVGAQLFATAQIILSVFALGLLGLLFPAVLLAVNAAVTAAVFLVGVRPGMERIVPFHRALWQAIRVNRKSMVITALLLLLIGITGWNLFWGWFLPPREWDGINYHLPIMAAFYQSHAIISIASPIKWIQFYPFDSELMEIWTLAVVGVDKIVDWTFIPSILAGGLAIFGTCRSLGVRREASVLGAAVFTFAPRILLQQAEAMNDALFAATIAAGVFMVMGLSTAPDNGLRRRLRLSAAGVAASAGLVAGMKFAGTAFALGLVILFLIRWIPPMRKSALAADRRVGWGWTLVLGVVLLLGLGSYPYLRNLIRNGNPVYPYIVEVDGVVLLPGIRDIREFEEQNTAEQVKSMSVVARTVNSWFEPYQSVYDNQMGGLGPLWIAVAVPALLLWIARLLGRPRPEEIALIGLLLAAVALTPAFWYPRYALPLLVPGGVAVGLAVDGLGRWSRRIVIAEVILLSVFSVFNTLAPKSVSWADARAVLLEQDDLTRSGPQFVHPSYGRLAYEWIDRYSQGRRLVVAYGENVYFPYLLYGTDLRNRVVHILPHDEEQWQAALREADVEIVLVRSDMPTYEWIIHDSFFQEVFRDGAYVIFEHFPPP